MGPDEAVWGSGGNNFLEVRSHCFDIPVFLGTMRLDLFHGQFGGHMMNIKRQTYK